MSVRKSIAAYTTAAIVIAVVLIGISTIAIPSPFTTQTGPTTSGSKVQSVPFPVLLTDPPIVPEGTKSLNLTYNQVQIGVSLNQAQHRWVSINASGTVDLLSLVNVSKTIALAQIPQGAAVEQIKFGISSVEIDVKGMTYNVTAVSSALTVPISGGANVQQLNVLLLDLTSHVVEIDTGNASSPIFVLIPNAVAVVRPSSNMNGNQNEVGAVSNLTSDDLHELDQATGAASLLARLSVSGQATSFSIAIENTGNVSLSLQAIRLEGHFNSTASQTSQCVSSESSSSSSATSHEGVVANALGGMDQTNTTAVTTTSTMETSTGTTSSSDVSTTTMSTRSSETGDQSTTSSITSLTMSSSSETGEQSSSISTSAMSTSSNQAITETNSNECEHGSMFETPSELVFIPNGTTLVPFAGDVSSNSNALVIPPNTTVTLTFSGTVTSTGESESNQILTIFPIGGGVYTISAELSNGVSAVGNVTAS